MRQREGNKIVGGRGKTEGGGEDKEEIQSSMDRSRD